MSRRDIPPSPFGQSDWTAWALELNEFLSDPDQHQAENTPVIIQLVHQLTGETYRALEDGILMYDSTANNVVCSVGGEWKGLRTLDNLSFDGAIEVDNAITIDVTANGGLTLNRTNLDQYATVLWSYNDVTQWNIGPSLGDPHTFGLNRFDATGTYLDTPFHVNSSNGDMSVANPLYVNGNTIVIDHYQASTVNTHLYFRNNGVNRAMIYQNASSNGASGNLVFSTFDNAGTWKGDAYIGWTSTAGSRVGAGDMQCLSGRYYGPGTNFAAYIQNRLGGFAYAADVREFGLQGGHAGSPTTIAWVASNSANQAFGYSWCDVWSDRRLKKNIKKAERDVLADLMSLDVVSYEWNDDAVVAFGDEEVRNRPVDVGLIAQDVEEVFPDAVAWVKRSPKDETLTAQINKKELVPHLIRAIQQLTERVEQLENERKSERVSSKSE